MPSRSRTLARKPKTIEPKSRKAGSETIRGLGLLPEWNLADLYPGLDSPEIKRDLDRADAYSVAFEETFKGVGVTLIALASALGLRELDGPLDGAIYGGVVGLGSPLNLSEKVIHRITITPMMVAVIASAFLV